MKKRVAADLLPRMMGSEHELSVSVVVRDYNYDENKPDRLDFISDAEAHIVTQADELDYSLWTDDDQRFNMLGNGSFLYHLDYEHPLELATPECQDPLELLKYSHAGREIIRFCAQAVLEEYGEYYRSISLNERVIDSNGITWGEHDNFSLIQEDPVINDCRLLILHLQTRGVVSGSGHVNAYGEETTFSQKVPTVLDLNGKKWGSTAMSFNQDRLEIRCSDKNVSEWAHLMRLGSAALVLALIRSGYSIDNLQDDLKEKGHDIGLYKAGHGFSFYDELKVKHDGSVCFRPENRLAIAIQGILAEKSCRLTEEVEGVIPAYKKIASQWQRFCRELLKTEVGTPVDLTQFVDTDWASKLLIVQKGMQKDAQYGIPRRPHDVYARAADIRYGQYTFDRPLADGKIFTVAGPGYLLNSRLPSRTLIKRNAILAATTEPPKGRAAKRVTTTRKLKDDGVKIGHIQWDNLLHVNPEDDSQNLLKQKLYF